MRRHKLILFFLSLFWLVGSILPARARTQDLFIIPFDEPCWTTMMTAAEPDSSMWFMWAGDPAVTFKTISGPTWKDCGEFEWKVKWFLTNASGADVQPTPQASESWIVQHIVAKYNIKNCDNTEYKEPNQDFYEAWRMGKNAEAISKYDYDFKGDGSKSTVDYSNDDKSDDDFLIHPGTGFPDTYGSWTVDANASYQAAIKAGEFSTGPGTPAGPLPHTDKAPSNLGQSTLTRHVESKWNCCPDSATKATTGTATANNKWNTYTESWVWDGTKMTHKKMVDGKEVAMLPPGAGPLVPPLGALASLVHGSPAWDGYSFDPGRLIAVANQLHAMGRNGALEALHAYRDELGNAPGEKVLNSTRIGLLIRVLFQAEKFPRMQVGRGELSDQEAGALPLYPLALVQDVPLLVDPSFILLGKAEDPLRQIEYCEQHCTFRAAPLTPSADLSTGARQIPSLASSSRNTSLLQAQLLRLAKGVCDIPHPGPDLFTSPALPSLLQECMGIFQSGRVVWAPNTNTYEKR